MVRSTSIVKNESKNYEKILSSSALVTPTSYPESGLSQCKTARSDTRTPLRSARRSTHCRQASSQQAPQQWRQFQFAVDALETVDRRSGNCAAARERSRSGSDRGFSALRRRTHIGWGAAGIHRKEGVQQERQEMTRRQGISTKEKRNSQAPPTFECYCQFYGESNLPFCACFFSFLSEFCGAGLISLNQWWDGSGCRP